MNHNKINSSSAGVSRFGACTDGILYLVGLQSSFFCFLEGGSFPSMWSAEQCYAKQWNRNSGLSYRRTLEEVDRTLKNSLLACKDFRDFLRSSCEATASKAWLLSLGDFLLSSVQNFREDSIGF